CEVLRRARLGGAAQAEHPPQDDGADRRERDEVDDDQDETEIHGVGNPHTGPPPRRLPRGIGGDRGAPPERALRGGDGDLAARYLEDEAVETTRGGAALLLADPVVFRAVARALEPL